MNQPHVHAAVLVSSVFLLRVQSEAMGLEVGMKRDAQVLPPGRHSAVWIESCEGGLDSLHIRLARRKHRLQGSLLVRTCACAGASPHCCAVHAVAPLLRNKGAGAPLFNLTSSSFLKAVRGMLTLLGHMEADKCTLKAFRAGRATSLTAAGSPFGVILAAGEWNLLHSSGTARPMRSPSLPSSRWSALRTRTEWDRRVEKSSWKTDLAFHMRTEMCSTDDESGNGQSTTTQNDVDSEVSFEDDADEEIDTTVIEEEDWFEYKREAPKMQWKRWHTQRFDAGTGPT